MGGSGGGGETQITDLNTKPYILNPSACPCRPKQSVASVRRSWRARGSARARSTWRREASRRWGEGDSGVGQRGGQSKINVAEGGKQEVGGGRGRGGEAEGGLVFACRGACLRRHGQLSRVCRIRDGRKQEQPPHPYSPLPIFRRCRAPAAVLPSLRIHSGRLAASATNAPRRRNP